MRLVLRVMRMIGRRWVVRVLKNLRGVSCLVTTAYTVPSLPGLGGWGIGLRPICTDVMTPCVCLACLAMASATLAARSVGLVALIL